MINMTNLDHGEGIKKWEGEFSERNGCSSPIIEHGISDYFSWNEIKKKGIKKQ